MLPSSDTTQMEGKFCRLIGYVIALFAFKVIHRVCCIASYHVTRSSLLRTLLHTFRMNNSFFFPQIKTQAASKGLLNGSHLTLL